MSENIYVHQEAHMLHHIAVKMLYMGLLYDVAQKDKTTWGVNSIICNPCNK
jgi:hypothetical protein